MLLFFCLWFDVCELQYLGLWLMMTMEYQNGVFFFSTVVATGGGPFGEESKTSGLERFVSYALDCVKEMSSR